MTAQYDISNLTAKVSALQGMIIGQGADEGQLAASLRSEMGQLGARIGKQIGPRDKSSATAKVTRDVKQHLAFLPMAQNLNQESESYADFTWLYASQFALVGVNDEDLQLQASGEEAMAMLRVGQKTQHRGDAWQELGRRGKQHIMRRNRVIVSKSAFNQVVRSIMGKTGMLKAAFYYAAQKFAPNITVPAWIAAKMPAVEAADKATTREEGSGTPQGFVEMTVRGAGLASNEMLTQKISAAVRSTEISLQAKCRKILDGAKYVFETGQVYFERN